MPDKMQNIIERTTAVIDLLAAIIFLAIIMKVYGHVDRLLEILK